MRSLDQIAVDLVSESTDNIRTFVGSNSPISVETQDLLNYVSREMLRVILESHSKIEEEKTKKCLSAN